MHHREVQHSVRMQVLIREAPSQPLPYLFLGALQGSSNAHEFVTQPTNEAVSVNVNHPNDRPKRPAAPQQPSRQSSRLRDRELIARGELPPDVEEGSELAVFIIDGECPRYVYLGARHSRLLVLSSSTLLPNSPLCGRLCAVELQSAESRSCRHWLFRRQDAYSVSWLPAA